MSVSPRKQAAALVLIVGFGVFLLVLAFGCSRPPATPVPGPVVEIPTTRSTPTPNPVSTVTPVPRDPLSFETVTRPTPTPKNEPPPLPSSLQAKRWAEAKIKPSFAIAVDKAVMLYERTHARYETVEQMRADGVPAPVIFTLHMRESSNSFTAHLHEGSSLLARTRYVPKNRPPPPAEPPFSWETSAYDALYVADKLQGSWTDLAWSLDKIEGYNGFGYRNRGVPSPYVWSGTDQYGPPSKAGGKFTSDGHFDAVAVDRQLGTAAVLKRMRERGIKLRFAPD